MQKDKSYRVFYDEPGGPPADPTPPPADPTPPTFDPATDSFRQFVPEDIRGDFESVPSFEALARGYHGSQKLIGKDPSRLLERPLEGDSAGMVTALQGLGAPADMAGWGDMKTLAGENGNSEFVQSYVEKVAIPTGMMPHQLKASLAFVQENKEAQAAATQTSGKEQIAKWQGELAQTWGTEIQSPQWKENIGAAAAVVEKFGGDGAFDALESSGMADHPIVLNMLLGISAALAGGSLEGTGGGGPAGSGRSAEISARIAELEKVQMGYVSNNQQAQARATAHQILALREEKMRLNAKG